MGRTATTSLQIIASVIDDASRKLDEIGKNADKTGFYIMELNQACELVGRAFNVAMGFASAFYGTLETLTKKAMEAEKAERDLTAALAAWAPKAKNAAELQNAHSDAVERAVGVASEQISQMKAQMLGMGVWEQNLKAATAAALGWKRITGKDLTSAMRDVVQLLEGGMPRALKRLAPEIQTVQEGMDYMRRGLVMLSADMGTLEGRLRQLDTSFEDFEKALGRSATESGAAKEMVTSLDKAFRDLAVTVASPEFKKAMDGAFRELAGSAATAIEALLKLSQGVHVKGLGKVVTAGATGATIGGLGGAVLGGLAAGPGGLAAGGVIGAGAGGTAFAGAAAGEGYLQGERKWPSELITREMHERFKRIEAGDAAEAAKYREELERQTYQLRRPGERKTLDLYKAWQGELEESIDTFVAEEKAFKDYQDATQKLIVRLQDINKGKLSVGAPGEAASIDEALGDKNVDQQRALADATAAAERAEKRLQAKLEASVNVLERQLRAQGLPASDLEAEALEKKIERQGFLLDLISREHKAEAIGARERQRREMVESRAWAAEEKRMKEADRAQARAEKQAEERLIAQQQRLEILAQGLTDMFLLPLEHAFSGAFDKIGEDFVKLLERMALQLLASELLRGIGKLLGIGATVAAGVASGGVAAVAAGAATAAAGGLAQSAGGLRADRTNYSGGARRARAGNAGAGALIVNLHQHNMIPATSVQTERALRGAIPTLKKFRKQGRI